LNELVRERKPWVWECSGERRSKPLVAGMSRVAQTKKHRSKAVIAGMSRDVSLGSWNELECTGQRPCAGCFSQAR